jgi:hypothetical protein
MSGNKVNFKAQWLLNMEMAGLDPHKGSDQQCPKCSKPMVVTPGKLIAKCFRCGYAVGYFRRSESHRQSWAAAAMQVLHDDWKVELETSIEAIKWLKDERGVHPTIIRLLPFGAVPLNYDPTRAISAAWKTFRTDVEVRKKEDSLAALAVQGKRKKQREPPNYDEEGKQIEAFEAKLRRCCEFAKGWVAIFYRNAHPEEEFVFVNFRNPLNRENNYCLKPVMGAWEESDENVKGIFGPVWNSGRYPAPFERSKGMLVLEGEFNLARLLSCQVELWEQQKMQGHCSLIDACSVGSATSCDVNTVFRLLQNMEYDEPITICPDADPAGEQMLERFRRVRGVYHFKVGWMLGDEKKSTDVDDFLRSYKESGKLKEGLTELANQWASAKFLPRPMEAVAEELSSIKADPDTPQDDKEKAILDTIEEDLAERATTFMDVYPHIFMPETGKIIRFHQDENDAHQLMKNYGLLKGKVLTGVIFANLESDLLANTPQAKIHRFGHLDTRDYSLYLNTGDGRMLVIGNNNSIRSVANGTNGIYMHFPGMLPIKLNSEKLRQMQDRVQYGLKVTEDSVFCQGFNARFGESNLNIAQHHQLYTARVTALWLGHAITEWPLCIANGVPESGKSAAFEKIGHFMLGADFSSAAMPMNERGFINKITSHPLCVFDNFENAPLDTGNYEDYICKCATGGTIPLAILYKTVGLVEVSIRTNAFFTACRMPYDRSDLMRRSLVFPIRPMLPEEQIRSGLFKQQFIEQRENMWLELVIRLARLREALQENQKEYKYISGISDFENYTLRVAEYEGWLPEMRDIWVRRGLDRGKLSGAREPVLNFAILWLGRSPEDVGKTVRGDYLFTRMADIAEKTKQKLPWPTSNSLGTALNKGTNLTMLKTQLGMETKEYGGSNRYTFNPSPEALAECKARWLEISGIIEKEDIC